jgi:hypothetical protein
MGVRAPLTITDPGTFGLQHVDVWSSSHRTAGSYGHRL